MSGLLRLPPPVVKGLLSVPAAYKVIQGRRQMLAAAVQVATVSPLAMQVLPLVPEGRTDQKTEARTDTVVPPMLAPARYCLVVLADGTAGDAMQYSSAMASAVEAAGTAAGSTAM
jgi:hypothetical protein